MRTLAVLAALALLSLSPAAYSQNGSAFCFGDGSGTPCPCLLLGGTGQGCANTTGTGGALLSGSGGAYILSDTFQLDVAGVPGSKPGLILRTANQVNGGLGIHAGDGLLCVSGQSLRSQVQVTSGGATTFKHFYGGPLGASSFGPGVATHYQFWYRDPLSTCSGSGFNFSNAWTVTWGLDSSPHAGMALIPAGSFAMGRHVGGGPSNELPVHNVSLDAFYMDIYEVTNQKYVDFLNTAYAQGRVTVAGNVVYHVGGAGEALCETAQSSRYSRITWNGSVFGVTADKEDHPVVEVSWYGACAYANGRSRMNGLVPCYDEGTWGCNFNANGYRLPTEAEWEYAARGGEHNPYYIFPWTGFFGGSNANYYDSGDPFESGRWPRTSPVGYYDGNQVPSGGDMLNGYGLYDIAGNVFEWCWDRYASNYYSNSPTSSPTGPASGLDRVWRGGCLNSVGSGLRLAGRSYFSPSLRSYYLGFRVLAVRP